jgi:integrase
VAHKSGFGNTRRLPSGRWQARYTGPDGRMHKAPFTFDTKGDAQAWLATTRADIVRDNWTPTGPRRHAALTFGQYADGWLTGRTLEARTRQHYATLLERLILPTFAETPLRHISPEVVRQWYATTALDRPTLRSHAYGLLRTILGQAERDELIPSNPCHVRGAGNTRRAKRVEPATLEQLETIVGAMPERYRLMALLASWCALRFGELAELRRGDVATKAGVVRIRRGVVRAGGETIVKRPKTESSIRDVAIPPHLMPAVRDHLLRHAEPGKDGLLFPARGGGHLQPSSLYRVFYPAREAAGRPDLRWHDLRHTGAVLAAQTGATLAELMGRLGHSTPAAALRYQHAAAGRDREIARRLSELAGGQP